MIKFTFKAWELQICKQENMNPFEQDIRMHSSLKINDPFPDKLFPSRYRVRRAQFARTDRRSRVKPWSSSPQYETFSMSMKGDWKQGTYYITGR